MLNYPCIPGITPHLINRMRDRNHKIISNEAEKVFNKIQHLLLLTKVPTNRRKLPPH
jgi:hypothetical protein